MTKACIIIPARLDSSRLPQKMLLNETGMPLIHHTFESAKQSSLAPDVVVATDSYEIYQSVKERFGSRSVVQTGKHDCGTDRVIEAARYVQMYDNYDIIVNVQGDMPIISGNHIDLLIRSIQSTDAGIATLTTKANLIDFHNPSCVKVVCNRYGNAMYFSRSPIPFQMKPTKLLRHVGIYAFRREILQGLHTRRIQRPSISDAEDLEQLTWLYHGHQIKVIESKSDIYSSIDTKDNYDEFVRLYSSNTVKCGQNVVFVKDYKVDGLILVNAGENGVTVEVPSDLRNNPHWNVEFCVKTRDSYWVCPLDCIRCL